MVFKSGLELGVSFPRLLPSLWWNLRSILLGDLPRSRRSSVLLALPFYSSDDKNLVSCVTMFLNGDYPIKETGRDSVTAQPSRSTMDGRKKGVALGGLGVPWRTWCPGGTVVPQGLKVLYCGSTRARWPDIYIWVLIVIWGRETLRLWAETRWFCIRAIWIEGDTCTIPLDHRDVIYLGVRVRTWRFTMFWQYWVFWLAGSSLVWILGLCANP